MTPSISESSTPHTQSNRNSFKLRSKNTHYSQNMTSAENPKTKTEEQGKLQSFASPQRYSLRFVTSSPTKSPKMSPAPADAPGIHANEEDQNQLHDERIAFDLTDLPPLSRSAAQVASPATSVPPLPQTKYKILPRNSDDDSVADINVDGVMDSSPSSSAGNSPSPKTSGVSGGGDSNNPFLGGPNLPTFAPGKPAVKGAPPRNHQEKKLNSAGQDTPLDTSGNVWCSQAFKNIVDDPSCIVAVELGDRNYLKHKYQDSIEYYEEALEQAYYGLLSKKQQSPLGAYQSMLLDDEAPTDEEGEGKEGDKSPNQGPISPDDKFLTRIGLGTVLKREHADTVLAAFAFVYIRMGNALVRMRQWDEATQSLKSAQAYLALIEPTQDAERSRRVVSMLKIKMDGQVMSNLAAIEASRGKHQDATTDYAEALRVKRRSLRLMLKQEDNVFESTPLSKEDAVLDITSTLTNIGQLRQKLEKFDKAEDAYKQVLSLRVEKCGERDISVASTLSRMGDLYFMQGKYERSLRSYEEVLKTYKKLGADDPCAATMLHNIGLVYYRIGPYSRAKSSLKQALKIKKKANQEGGRLDLASTYHLLGVVLTATGQYDSAMKCLVTALRVRQMELGESSKKNLSILNTRLAIGEIYRQQGDLDQAMEEFSEVCEARIERLGFGHEACAEAVQCIGLAMREKGDYSEAVSMLEKSLAVRKARLGPESPLVAETLVHLSGCYFKQRRIEEATEASEASLRIVFESLGDEHIMYSNSLKSVADLQQARGEFKEALASYSQVLSIKNRWLGDSHLECSEVHNNVGNAKFKMADFHGAVAAFTKALEIKRSCLDESHTSFYTTLNNLGHAHYKCMDLGKALDMYQQSLQCQMQRLCGGKDENAKALEKSFDFLSHLQRIVQIIEAERDDKEKMDQITFALGNVASTLRNIGLVKQDQAKIDEALEVYGFILSVRKAMPVVDQAAVALTAETIGMLHFKQGNHDGALAAFGEALHVKERTQGTHTLDYARTLNNIANVYFSAGNLEKAMDLYQRALAIKKEHLGVGHDEVASTQNNVAHLLFTLGRDEEALEAYNEVLRMRKYKFGPDHEAVAATLSNIGDLHVKCNNPEKALSAFNESIRIRKIQAQPNAVDISRALESAASAYGKLGQWLQARVAYSESLGMKKLVYGDSGKEEIVKTLDLLAMSIIEQGLFEEATVPVKEALDLRRKLLGNDHSEVTSQIKALAYLFKKAGKDDEAMLVLVEISEGSGENEDDLDDDESLSSM